ncbi:MAG: metallophosphoesterase [Chloroflexota bacterium]|nr:metallophosphoesterase [Chloroflexota bacterium]
MLVALIGDVHGRIFHAIAALATLQARMGAKFDLLIQVGDLGYPELDRADAPTRLYLAIDPAEADLSRFLRPDIHCSAALRSIRESFACPIYFVRGNHEDFSWLAGLPVDPATRTAPTDPFDLLHYVPDGTVLDRAGSRVAFLGGVEEQTGEAAIDMDAYRALIGLGAGAIDLLVTHEGPYGSSTGYRGDVHGSRLMSRLLEALEPQWHVFGHAHSLEGPRIFGRTTYLGLDGLVASPRWQPHALGLQPGCLGILDTTKKELSAVTDEWLRDFPTPFIFDDWAASPDGLCRLGPS